MTDEIETDADGTNVDFLLRIIARGNRKLAKAESERDAALARVEELERAIDDYLAGRINDRQLRAALTPPDYPPEQPL